MMNPPLLRFPKMGKKSVSGGFNLFFMNFVPSFLKNDGMMNLKRAFC